MINLHQLKSAGVPLDNHYELRKRITDFGISTGLRNTIRMTYGVEAGTGTTEYRSYECLDEKPRNVIARDIWAFGVTLYELMTGDVPFGKFGGMTQKTAVKAMLDEKYKFLQEKDSRYYSMDAASIEDAEWYIIYNPANESITFHYVAPI